MYTRYFGLREKPFTIAPDPRYLYLSKLHREALAHLLYGVHSDGCLILLTGDVGTGKTTVCRCLLAQLPEKTDIAIILNPKLTIVELFKTICTELDVPVTPDSPSGKTYVDSLNSYLLDAHAKGRSTVLIIDEAQNLSAEILEQLRLLTNLETDTHKLLQIVLLGQTELRDMISSPQLTQINQRVTSRYHLQPLKPDDVRRYIRHRIYIAGSSDTSLFSAQAIRYIIKISKGIPRTINLLCDRALLGAYAEHKDHVDLQIMKKAVKEVTGGSNRQVFSFKRLTLVLLLLLLGVCLPVGLYFSTRDITLPQLLQSKMQQPVPDKVPDLISEGDPSQQDEIIINPIQLHPTLDDITEPSHK